MGLFCYGQIVANNLWDYLGDSTPECHARAVDLLNQLHQLSPDSWICEDVISRSLLSDHKVWLELFHCLTNICFKV